MPYSADIAGLIEKRRAQLDAQKENTARLAKSHFFWTTVGTGEFLVDGYAQFDCIFTEKPHFTYGAEVSGDQQLLPTKYPRTHGGVYNWVRAKPPGNVAGLPGDNADDDVMYYTGAYVYFVVDILSPGVDFTRPQPNYAVIHHMAFEGTAVKNVPAYQLDV